LELPDEKEIDNLNSYGESEGSPSEEGLTIDSQVSEPYMNILGRTYDSVSQTALDFVRADPILRETKVVSGLFTH
jgi:hypothetical protein